MKRYCAFLLLLCLAFLASGPAAAEPTQVLVRLLSRGAKFIGTSMGGVEVVLHDAHTGELLARGVTAGGTGDTEAIMRRPRDRREPVPTGEAALFAATLDLDEPRLLRVTAFGPRGQLQSANTVSATQWVVPGRHLDGPGWILEMPGFAVDVLAPAAHGRLRRGPVEIEANVTLMCGCGVEPGGLWDANRYEIAALVRRDGKRVGESVLAFAGMTSRFRGTVDAQTPGLYEVTVFAFDRETGNTGLDRVTFFVD